jgi:hypothetical protein
MGAVMSEIEELKKRIKELEEEILWLRGEGDEPLTQKEDPTGKYFRFGQKHRVGPPAQEIK